ANTWSIDNQPMPASTGGPLADGAQCADSSHVYFINGIDQSFLYSSLQVWDRTQPAGSRWSFKTFPQINGKAYASQASGCAVLGGKVYLFGGYGIIQGQPAASLQKVTLVYDPATDTWSGTGKPMTTGAIWFGYTKAGGQAWAAGGVGNLSTFVPTPVVESFSPSTGWANRVPLPTPAGADTPGLVAEGMGVLGNNLTVFGGAGLNQATNTFFIQNRQLICTLPCTTGTWG